MEKNMLVGVTGAKRSGKDQFAEYLAKHNADVQIFKFADALKEGILHGFHQSGIPCTYEDLDGDGVDREERYLTSLQVAGIFHYANEKLDIGEWEMLTLFEYMNSKEARIAVGREEFPPKHLIWSIREVLQLYGTEIVRKVSDNFWVEEVERRYLEAKMRNPNVIGVVTDTRFDNEATFIRNYNGKLFRVIRYGAILNTGHASEAGLSDYSDAVIINNNSSLEDLESLAKQKYF